MRHSITSSSLYSALDLFLEADEEILSDPEHVITLSEDIETSLPTRPVAAGQWWGVSRIPSTNDLLARLATFQGQASESFLSLAPRYYGEIQQLSINEENNFYFNANNYLAHSPSVILTPKSVGVQHGTTMRALPLLEVGGEGDLFLAGLGELIHYTLAAEETRILVSRSLVGFHGTVSLEWTRANRDGSGGFVGANSPTLRLTGPGLIIYQTRG